jgi:hypothetical protein
MNEITLIVITITILIIFYYYNKKDICYIKSTIDEKFYLVRNIKDKDKASFIIGRIVQDLKKLTNYCKKNIKNFPKMKLYINRMYNRINGVIFRESSAYSPYTSYTVNKGDEMVLCIRSKRTNKIHDYNILIYVAIHELGHIACPEIGHTKLFFKINRFLLKQAIKLNIYTYDNYNVNNKSYCGMNIGNNILS